MGDFHMIDADRYHIPPAQAVNAACVVDLAPLLRHFEAELSAARTAAADARIEARGHRERVVELEAKLKAEQERVAEWTRKATDLAERLEHARCDAKDAQQMLLDERRMTQVPPRTGPAAVEAYRLLVGVEPKWEPNNGWTADLSDDDARIAAVNILRHLDRVAPGGKP